MSPQKPKPVCAVSKQQLTATDGKVQIPWWYS